MPHVRISAPMNISERHLCSGYMTRTWLLHDDTTSSSGSLNEKGSPSLGTCCINEMDDPWLSFEGSGHVLENASLSKGPSVCVQDWCNREKAQFFGINIEVPLRAQIGKQWETDVSGSFRTTSWR